MMRQKLRRQLVQGCQICMQSLLEMTSCACIRLKRSKASPICCKESYNGMTRPAANPNASDRRDV